MDNFSSLRYKGNYLVKFKILLHSGEAKSVAPLSSIIGQFGLNCQEFCQKFNDKCNFLTNGVPVLVNFYVLQDKKFEFELNRIAINRLLLSQFFIRNGRRCINKLVLYKFYLMVLNLLGFGLNDNKKIFNTLIGNLKSNKLRKIFNEN